MALNLKQMYEEVFHDADYWRFRYEWAKGDLFGMNKEPALMSREDWSEWYDATVPENPTYKQVAELHEKLVKQLKGEEVPA